MLGVCRNVVKGEIREWKVKFSKLKVDCRIIKGMFLVYI